MRSGREQLSRLLESSSNVRLITQLHSLLIRSGQLTVVDCFFATRLVSSYAKVTSSSVARKLFDEIPHPNSFLWNAILRAHCRAHQWVETLHLFHCMASVPSKMDAYTLPNVLKACAELSLLHHGRAIHAVVVKSDRQYTCDMFVAAALVEMYAKCSEMCDAIRVFEGFEEPDVVLWTSVVSGYQQNGYAEKATAFFSKMVFENHLMPDPVTLVSVLSALGEQRDLQRGGCCHGFLIRRGFCLDIALVNSLLNFYAKMGQVKTAKRLFETMLVRDVISWSCMISCYAHNGRPIAALKVYRKMIELGVEPNSVTIISALQACSLACHLQEGRILHELALQKGLELEMSVATSLIDMYMNCSCYKEAISLFYRIPSKDAVSWATTIDGYTKNGFAGESLKLFKVMLLDNKVNPDAVTMLKVIDACSQMGVLCQAHCFHSYLIRCGFSDKVYVGAALIDLYSKCGSLDGAVRVYEGMFERDLVVWSSMIAAYGINGFGKKAVSTFECMIKSCIIPNNITFVSVLSACSHSGMVQEARRIFDSMGRVFGVTPDSKHYCIMVDLLARVGELQEALKLIEEMPKPVDPHVWCALLSGCRLYQDIEMGELVALRLLEIDASYAGYYNLLANMYASGGKWNKAEKVMRLIKERGLIKTPGYSSVLIGNDIRTFLAGGKIHQQEGKIRDMLRGLEVNIVEDLPFDDQEYPLEVAL
ncbi:Putative pentatricopeptide repeat-containing protein [Apostasia shenzhenica]|uniref:Pentatricopeptide repeat-containing protein n=1 Tax=Apostasia shenzhenica TaxID=1088818 RepID=A0A2I0ABP0_9ASPA|nr:Putative pentatricopeptide repeat-containing protein [Apostasia shenzhenica]